MSIYYKLLNTEYIHKAYRLNYALVFCPHWSTLAGNNHHSYAVTTHSDESTTSQIIHTCIYIDYETELSTLYWINSTKCNVESNHHSKYPGQNITWSIYIVYRAYRLNYTYYWTWSIYTVYRAYRLNYTYY